MTKLSFARDLSAVSAQAGSFIKKRQEALAKINSFREDFGNKEKEMRADLEEAGRIWKELGERFKWWGTLP